ncbi:MAG: hypothetical protein HFJ17_04510 [Clostridia bacterium]|nr:hypothetical protein [Clostridia bacterium]
MGILMGLRPSTIELMPFGFFIRFDRINKKNNTEIVKAKILIAVAGPITNLIFILILGVLNIPYVSNDILVYINLIILGFNLLPIYPLDGGRALEGILESKLGIRRATIYINKISNIYIILITMIASIALYYFKNIAILLIVLYLWLLILKENKKFKIRSEALNFITNRKRI